LDPGNTVRIRPPRNKQNWTKAINGKLNIRSYQVTTEDGRTTGEIVNIFAYRIML
jgi:hypothetical protein